MVISLMVPTVCNGTDRNHHSTSISQRRNWYPVAAPLSDGAYDTRLSLPIVPVAAN